MWWLLHSPMFSTTGLHSLPIVFHFTELAILRVGLFVFCAKNSTVDWSPNLRICLTHPCFWDWMRTPILLSINSWSKANDQALWGIICVCDHFLVNRHGLSRKLWLGFYWCPPCATAQTKDGKNWLIKDCGTQRIVKRNKVLTQLPVLWFSTVHVVGAQKSVPWPVILKISNKLAGDQLSLYPTQTSSAIHRRCSARHSLEGDRKSLMKQRSCTLKM